MANKEKKNWVAPFMLIALGMHSPLASAREHGRTPAGSGVGINLTDVARNADGTVMRLDHAHAESYCLNQGLRLPTIQELAEWVIHSGDGSAISDTPLNGFHEFDGLTPDGEPDKFYFSWDNFHIHSPIRDLSHYWYWSSSSDSGRSESAFYTLAGWSAYISSLTNRDFNDNYFGNGVSCLRSL